MKGLVGESSVRRSALMVAGVRMFGTGDDPSESVRWVSDLIEI